MDLPGYEEALDLGYTVRYYGGDKKSASYMKNGVLLTIVSKEYGLEAHLELVWKLLLVKTPSFTFPNENFKVFENQVLLAKDRLGKE